jgi:hypothetical protein
MLFWKLVSAFLSSKVLAEAEKNFVLWLSLNIGARNVLLMIAGFSDKNNVNV